MCLYQMALDFTENNIAKKEKRKKEKKKKG